MYDVKSDLYNTPFFMPAKGQAIRAFVDLANDERSMICKHPGDFKLVDLGEFDDVTGDFFPSGGVSMGFASEFIVKRDVPSVLREVS